MSVCQDNGRLLRVDLRKTCLRVLQGDSFTRGIRERRSTTGPLCLLWWHAKLDPLKCFVRGYRKERSVNHRRLLAPECPDLQPFWHADWHICPSIEISAGFDGKFRGLHNCQVGDVYISKTQFFRRSRYKRLRQVGTDKCGSGEITIQERSGNRAFLDICVRKSNPFEMGPVDLRFINVVTAPVDMWEPPNGVGILRRRVRDHDSLEYGGGLTTVFGGAPPSSHLARKINITELRFMLDKEIERRAFSGISGRLCQESHPSSRYSIFTAMRPLISSVGQINPDLERCRHNNAKSDYAANDPNQSCGRRACEGVSPTFGCHNCQDKKRKNANEYDLNWRHRSLPYPMRPTLPEASGGVDVYGIAA